MLYQQTLYIYYCQICFTPLYETENALSPEYLRGRQAACPECNAALQENLAYRKSSTSTQVNFTQAKLTETKSIFNPVFQSAISLLGLRFGIRGIDSIFGGLVERTHTLISGNLSNVLAERICLKAILPAMKGGLGTRPIFIDAGNCSDPYLFAYFARLYQTEPKKSLESVITSRVFTVHQLVNLVARELPLATKKYGSKLVILADILSMLDDDQISQREKERIVEEIAESIRRLKEENLLILSTIPRRNQLQRILLTETDLTFEAQQSKSRSMKISVKCPGRNAVSVSIAQSDLLGTEIQYKAKEVLLYG